jgi:glycosyltransferase involved in cell wall biosynthesis
MRKLTIGMATHDDYDGLYFSIQSIRMFHKEILDDIEFVIVDNNPNSDHGKSNRKLLEWIQEPVQYLPFTKFKSTTVKNKVFELADTPYVLCIDSHVTIQPGAIKKLIEFYDDGNDDGNLLQGPLIYDDMKSISTHFKLNWSGHMWGQWDTDPRGIDPTSSPFEIPAQGMGLFSSRKESWLGYNKEFRGFGGEEGYIHEKYRKHGKKTICLPFLLWLHRFERPNGVTYPNNLHERFRNYLIGFHELRLPTLELEEHFKDVISPQEILNIKQELNIP